MNPFDENPNPVPSQEPAPATQESMKDLAARIVVHTPDGAAHPGGEPNFVVAAPVPPPPPANAFLPEDLRITWGWPHFFGFLGFGFVSFVITQVAAGIYLVAKSHIPHPTQEQLRQMLISQPQVPIAANIALFALIIFFLYVTLSVVKGIPYWVTLGWRKLKSVQDFPSNPWLYLAAGIGLSICVAMVSYFVKPKEALPIEDLLRSRIGLLLVMGTAVFVAPLVEETVFRGYLYPLFASTYARSAMNRGADPESAVRRGTGFGIVLTGTLFGLMHGLQLGWNLALVSVLLVVGLIFTFVRARTGSVLASFLLHLGYNSFIALAAIISTRGFTQIPPHP